MLLAFRYYQIFKDQCVAGVIPLTCFYYTVIGCFVNPPVPQFPKELGISFGVNPVEENGEEVENLVEDDLAVEFHFVFLSSLFVMLLLYSYRLWG